MSTSRIMFGMAVLLLGGAAVLLLLPSAEPAEPSMAVDPLATDLGMMSTGPRTLTFSITNPADRSRRVIGLAEG